MLKKCSRIVIDSNNKDTSWDEKSSYLPESLLSFKFKLIVFILCILRKSPEFFFFVLYLMIENKRTKVSPALFSFFICFSPPAVNLVSANFFERFFERILFFDTLPLFRMFFMLCRLLL